MFHVRVFVAAIWLLTANLMIVRGCPLAAVEIQLHDRVLCIGVNVSLESNGRQDVQLPFGTLFKVAQIKGERCLVFDSFHGGWIDRRHLLPLRDPALLEVIDKASVPPAEKQFAMGNYQLRRSPSAARRHFEEAIRLDPNLAHACVEHVLLVGMLGDEAAFWQSLEQLKRFPEREDVLLVHRLANETGEDVVRRCREVARGSDFLKGELAGHFMRSNEPGLLAEAYDLALASQQALPMDPRRSHTCGLICCVMREKISVDDPQHDQITQSAIRHLSQAIVSDPYFGPSYEALAVLYRKIGRDGEAIRLAQASLRTHPRSSRAAGFLAQYFPRLTQGDAIQDPAGIAIAAREVMLMDEFSDGLKRISHLALPLAVDEHEEDVRLNGYGPLPVERILDDDGQSALHVLVASRSYSTLIRLAQSFELNWSQLNSAGRAPLHEALMNNNLEAVHWLLTAGANPDVTTASGQSGWMIACQQGNPAMMARLARCSSFPATAVEVFRKQLDLPADASVETIKTATRARLVSELDELTVQQLPQLLTQYQEARALWQQAQQQRQQQASQPLPRNNAPIVVPGYIDDIAKYDPSRGQRMLHRHIGREVQEELEFHRQQQAYLDNLVAEHGDLQHELCQKAQALAYQAHTIAYLALSNEEFENYAATRGTKIAAQLAAAGIPWQLAEPAPAGR